MTNSIFTDGIFAQGYGFSPKIVMRDKNLTIESKAIYAYLSSYSGTGFSSFPSVDLLCHDLGITRQRYAKHRKLLETNGYLTVTQERGETGFNRNIYKLNTVVQKNVGLRNVTSQNVTTENVTSQNHTTNSNNLKSNNLNSNNNGLETAFEIYWSAGMVKTNKKKSLSLFASHVKANKLCPTEFANLLAKDVKARLAANQMGFDRMHPTTYLNGERWEDQVVVNHDNRTQPDKPVFRGQIV